MSTATAQKREELLAFIQREVVTEPAVQFDFKRLDLAEWSRPTHVWPEPLLGELSEGWVAYDPDGRAGRLITERTAYPDEVRRERLDEALIQLDLLLDDSNAERVWVSLGPHQAHARLHSAWDYLVQAIFAYNCRWRTWRSRELSHLVNLPWLPDGLAAQMLGAMNALSETEAGYRMRLEILQALFSQVIARFQEDGLYGSNPISEAFIRRNDEPGRSWKIAEWSQRHLARK
jgi:hypothetical protein